MQRDLLLKLYHGDAGIAGDGTSSGGPYVLTGTIGQPDATGPLVVYMNCLAASGRAGRYVWLSSTTLPD
jgi:hypothetical protein